MATVLSIGPRRAGRWRQLATSWSRWRAAAGWEGSGPPGGGGPLGRSGGAHVVGARTLGARLDVELDPLAATEAVEVERGIEATAVEEGFLRILGGDEAKAAIGDDLLDGTGGHCG